MLMVRVKVTETNMKGTKKEYPKDVSWGSFESLEQYDCAMTYAIRMIVKTPSGRELKYERRGSKVLVNEK